MRNLWSFLPSIWWPNDSEATLMYTGKLIQHQIIAYKIKRGALYFSGDEKALGRRHYERNGVSNHRRLDGLLNRLLRRKSEKTSKIHVTVFCEGTLPVTGDFFSQRDSNPENFHLMTSSWKLHISQRTPTKRTTVICKTVVSIKVLDHAIIYVSLSG